MKSIIKLIMLLTVITAVAQENTESLREQKLFDSIAKVVEKDNKDKKLAPSIWGTNSTTYDFAGYNYNDYKGGKYAEVAKAQNWSSMSIPSNPDKLLSEYENEKLIKKILIGISILLLFGLIFYFVRKKKVNK